MPTHPISRRAFLGAAGAISAIPLGRAFAGQTQPPATGLDFPVVDYHVHVEGGVSIDHVLQLARERGVKVGIAGHGGSGGMKNDADLQRFLASLEGKHVYRGMQGDGMAWPKMFSRELIAKLDYVLSDAMELPQKDGSVLKLWTSAAVINDEQEFMERYLAHHDEIMKEPIDILAHATFLPDDILHNYSVLWTNERMERVIETARKNIIAIEICGEYKVPSRKFIRKAKAAGLKFSFGSNTHGEEVGRVGYGIQMAKECGLTSSNMFTPAPHDLKPIIRRGV